MLRKIIPQLAGAVLGLMMLAGPANAQTQCVTNALAGGTGDAITVPLLPCGQATNLLILTLSAANTSTSPTLQMVGFPALPIVNADGTSVPVGALKGAGAVALLSGTGTKWLLMATGTFSANGLLAVDSVAQMQALGAQSPSVGTLIVNGYSAAGDGGGGTFYWDTTSTATAGLCGPFAANGVATGRWLPLNRKAVLLEQCGAKGDTINTSGNVTLAASGTTLTVSGAAFTSADCHSGGGCTGATDKPIVVFGAGVAGGALSTSIVNYLSATQVVVGNAGITGMSAVASRVSYGTDDGDSLNAAMLYGAEYSIPINGSCRIYGTTKQIVPGVAAGGLASGYTISMTLDGAAGGNPTECARGVSAFEWIGDADPAGCGSTDSCHSTWGLAVATIGTVTNSSFSNLEFTGNCLVGHAVGLYDTDTTGGAVRRQLDRLQWNNVTFQNGTVATVLVGKDSVTTNSDLTGNDDIAADTWYFKNSAFQSSCATTAPHVKMTGFNIYNMNFQGGNSVGTAPFAGAREFYFVGVTHVVMDGIQFTPLWDTISDVDALSVVFSSSATVRLQEVQSEDVRLLYDNGDGGDFYKSHVFDHVLVNNVLGMAGFYSYKNIGSTAFDCRDSSLYTFAAGTDYYSNLQNAGPLTWNNCRLEKNNSGALFIAGSGVGSVNLNGPLTSANLQTANFNFQDWTAGVPTGYSQLAVGTGAGSITQDTSGTYSENGKDVATVTCTPGDCTGLTNLFGLEGPNIPVKNLVGGTLESIWFGTTDGVVTSGDFVGLLSLDTFTAFVGGNQTIINPANDRFATIANYPVVDSGTNIIPSLALVGDGTLHVAGNCNKIIYGGADYSPAYAECRMTPSALANR